MTAWREPPYSTESSSGVSQHQDMDSEAHSEIPFTLFKGR